MSTSPSQTGGAGPSAGKGTGQAVVEERPFHPPMLAQIAQLAQKNRIAPNISANDMPISTPSPFLKSKSMPVRIPGGRAHSPHTSHSPHHEDFSITSPSASPPSTSSSPGSSAALGATDALGRPKSFTSRPRDPKVGIARPRHSLSVSVVRRRANSVASSPVTSDSYSSLAQSPAVSFLSSLADMSISQGPARGEYVEGDQVGDFLLGREIGAGAFSRVFEAEVIDGPYKQLGKVAMKIVVKTDTADDGSSQNIQRLVDHETTIWSRLRHPHILEMLELMDAEDAVFVVSELTSGGNLLDHIRANGRLSEPVSRKLFQQVASALRYLHFEEQVVHRDVKCENILLDSLGNAKLADFGLSAHMSPDAALSPGSPTTPEVTATSPNEPVYVMGSVHYASPEELRKTTTCNPASDLWSLGVVLYAMLTGGLPFNDGFMPRLQMQILSGRWDQTRLDSAGCSEEAKAVVRGLLKPKVDDVAVVVIAVDDGSI
ncbi:hypothetical protein HKX48_000361 [Thoreauomyces humboldtii]|nr:hypothetical protein HKX48_000361 [Thoreauomyces humboldtii]